MPKQRSDKQRNAIARAVADAFSAAGALRILGLRVAGGNYKTLYAHIRSHGLDTRHWTGQGHLRGRNHYWAKETPLKDILVEDSSYRGGTNKLKQRLSALGLLSPGCSSCNILDWCSRPLVMHLDHINGVANDNRLSNLRLLCPNCHSQTVTYCGRNKRLRRA